MKNGLQTEAGQRILFKIPDKKWSDCLEGGDGGGVTPFLLPAPATTGDQEFIVLLGRQRG